MTKQMREAITLGEDVGGLDASAITSDHVHKLRRLLAAKCLGPYSSILDEFALILRIDGSIQAWGMTGVDAVFIRNSRRYATADIMIPRDAWARQDGGAYFCSFLATSVRAAIEAIVKNALKKKVDIAQDTLLADVNLALSTFLSEIVD